MTYEAWPSPDAPRGPLPRIDDLPIAEQGYDQEAVREAFDSFYRHAAQLDASLKSLEAVEVFRREASELRSDLRSLRSLGYGSPEPSSTPSLYTYERPRRELPAAVPRIAAEVVLLIAIAVAAGVAHFRAWVIVAVMAGALVLVALSEWLAGRARYRVPEPSSFFTGDEREPAPYVEASAPQLEVGWSAFEAAGDGPEPAAEELTMVGVEPDPPENETETEPEPEQEDGAEAEPEAEPAPAAEAEPEEEVAATEAEAAEQPEPEQPRRRWFRRQEQAEPEPPAVAEPPSHVRVLAAGDPWERAFDGDVDDDAESNPDDLAERGAIARIRRRRR